MKSSPRFFVLGKLFACLFCLSLAFAVVLSAFAQQTSSAGLWQEVKESTIRSSGARSVTPRAYRTVSVNKAAMTSLLSKAPLEFTAAAKAIEVIVTIPTPEGGYARFRIAESPMISPAVAKERPDWKTYSGRGIDDPTAVLRMSWSAEGVRAYVVGSNGAYYVDPYAAGDSEHSVVYAKKDASDAGAPFHCAIDEYISRVGSRAPVSQPNATGTPEFSAGPTLRTYRVAIATTGEYTVNRGGQSAALTDVMNAVNRINLIYRRDLAVSLTLVSGTNTIFADPATDPYDNTDSGAQLQINQTQLDTIIGAANYDLGHLFGTGGGGVALSPSVCSNGDKGQGYSARVPPTGDAFWVDYVSHEMGHQLSAQHTYNTLEGGVCSTRSPDDAFEVASGSTIMSYVGICGERNLQQFSTDVFHVRSLTQIIAETNSGTGATCGTTTPTNNSAPVANAGPSFTIPKQTPFTLTASATDANAGDTLTYLWDEYDLAPSPSGPNGTPPNTYDVDTDGVLRPLFRSYPATTSPSRTFPSLPYILNNANVPPLTYTGTSPTGTVCEANVTCVTGENLPTVTRTMNFRVVVRDNQTGINDAGMQVNVRGDSGPFIVTAPNTAAATFSGASTTTVTWNVANTTAAPVSTANVKISLSTDGGQTFPTVLLASTPNDGSEDVTLPNVSTSTARIKVEAVGNIYFDISDANFTINAVAPTPTPTPTATPSPTATPTPTPSPTASPSASPTILGNISTRLSVQTGDNVLIGGFIVSGTAPKKVIVRAIGPSVPVAGKLANPILELHGPNGLIATNDDWRTGGQEAEIIATTVQPTNDLESAIVATIPANNTGYTAIVRGVNSGTGVGLVEVYDLNTDADSKLANISTRGFVQTGDNVMIGGFIITGSNPLKVIVRAIGPSLPVTDKLANPTLDLVDQNGSVIRSNDNWRTGGQEAEIIASNVPPTNDLESAVVVTLPPSQVTAVVRGANGTTGVALVEVFALP